ncbi:MAG: TonB family protein [Candidatus Acidiferrum sp.]
MGSINRENEVLTVAPEAASTVSAPAGPRLEDTASRPQPVALEVPVTVNGARTVEGSDKREPFSETTKTVLVFGNGAVIRLGSPVSAGQLLFLTNEKTKKEVVCQVVKSKNYRNVSGYVELEFTESVVGFWGMRFPSDRLSTQTAVPSASTQAPAKSIPVVPFSAAPKVVSPAISPTPGIPEGKPAPIRAGVGPGAQTPPAEVRPVAPLSSKPVAPSIQTMPAPVTPEAKNPAMPAIPAPSMSASLVSSVVSLLSERGVLPVPSEDKSATARVAPENSSEELRLQAARLQEQLSSLLFSATPAAKPEPPVPVLDSKAIEGVAAKVLEMSKSDPAPSKAAPPAKTLPPPIKSSLDTEEVKIPSWLEPLARNAAASTPAHESIDREKSKHTVELSAREERSEEILPAPKTGSTPEIELPGIGNLLPLDEGAITNERSSRSSRRGVWAGVIAAAVLLAAGGAWYEFYPSNAPRNTPLTIPTAHGSPTTAVPPTHTETPPAEHPASRNVVAEPEAAAGSERTPRSDSAASGVATTKPAEFPRPAPVTRDTPRNSASAIPASITERIPRVSTPEPEEPKKPALGEVHLASPTMSHAETQQADRVIAPTISTSNANANSEGLGSGLAAGNGKQPIVPLPVGGDVTPAKLISEVAPVYPSLARNEHISGDVVIDALIDANGHVTTMKIISGPALLYQAAKDALHQWQYQPASLDGKMVAMHLTVTLKFRM